MTGIIDLDAGRLVGVLPARSARAVTDWLVVKPTPWRAGVRHVVIDSYQPYAAQLPDVRLVVDNFHVIRLEGHERRADRTWPDILRPVTLASLSRLWS